MLTPLDAQLGIDHAHFAAHAKSLIATGCGGVTAFGTTGEGASFSLAERRDAVDALIAGGVPARQIIVSTSCAALPETIELTRHAVQAGTHGSLMLPPFFLKGVSDQGVIDCYRQVIDAVADSRLKMYLYHIPQVTGVGLSHHVISTLLKLYPDTIVGIKDSACTTAHSVGLAEAFMPPLTVYVGFEPDLPEMARRGSTGAISGLANFLPRMVGRLVSQHDAPTTEAERQRIIALINMLGGYSLMPALKSLMATVSGDTRWLRVRAPLVAVSADEHARLAAAYQQWGINPALD